MLTANDVSTGNQLYRISFSYFVAGINRGLPYSIKTVGNNLYIAGVFNSVEDAGGSQLTRNGACAINLSTGLLQNFNLNLNTSCARYVDAYNGNLIFSGPFTQAGDSAREHFVMLDTGTLALRPWNPSPSDEIKTIGFSGGRIFLGGLFNGIQSFHRNGLAGFDGVTGAVLPFNPPVSNSPAITAGKKMVIKGDTLFLLGHTDRLNSSGTEWTSFLLYSLSADTIIASPLFNINSIHDFLLDGSYLYAADNFSIERFTLPGLSLDAVWKADFSNGLTSHEPQSLCVDPVSIYAVGDNRVSSGSIFQSPGSTYLDRINKTTSSTVTTWAYTDTIGPPPNAHPHFDRAILADSLIFVQGEFSSLNGRTARNVATINLNTGNPVAWSPPLAPIPGTGGIQTFSHAYKLLLSHGALWFGLDYLNTNIAVGYPDPAHPVVFGAIDSASGQVIPPPATFLGKSYTDLGYFPMNLLSSYVSIDAISYSIPIIA